MINEVPFFLFLRKIGGYNAIFDSKGSKPASPEISNQLFKDFMNTTFDEPEPATCSTSNPVAPSFLAEPISREATPEANVPQPNLSPVSNAGNQEPIVISDMDISADAVQEITSSIGSVNINYLNNFAGLFIGIIFLKF